MAFEPVKLVHPKTGVSVVATTAVDLTTFRYDGGYIPVADAKALVKVEGADKKFPKLAEGLKALEAAEEPKAEEPKAARGPKTTAKSGTDASGNQVGVN